MRSHHRLCQTLSRRTSFWYQGPRAGCACWTSRRGGLTSTRPRMPADGKVKSDKGMPLTVGIAAAALIGRSLDIRAGATRTTKGLRDALIALCTHLYKREPSEEVVDAYCAAKMNSWKRKAEEGRMFVTSGSVSHYQAPFQLQPLFVNRIHLSTLL